MAESEEIKQDPRAMWLEERVKAAFKAVKVMLVTMLCSHYPVQPLPPTCA